MLIARVACFRWLRQPLLNHDEINARLDIVQLLKEETTSRHELVEGPLKNVPDLDAIVLKFVLYCYELLFFKLNTNDAS